MIATTVRRCRRAALGFLAALVGLVVGARVWPPAADTLYAFALLAGMGTLAMVSAWVQVAADAESPLARRLDRWRSYLAHEEPRY
jgi:hypothetical protein